MAKYTIGLDYGTLSGRAVLVDVKTGDIAAVSEYVYPHGVMNRTLPCGAEIKPAWALEHPDDYEQVLYKTIPAIMAESGIDKSDVIGIGIDATACTILPLDADGQPLCRREKYKSEPNAYIKMWKHHGANDRAEKMTEIAKQRGEKWIESFGGHISGESMFPRLWELMDEAPELFSDMYEYAEVADWIVFMLTGEKIRNSCAAGYKAYYNKQSGYPDPELFKAVALGLDKAASEKLPSPVKSSGSYAGGLTEEMAGKLGLCTGTPVAVGHVDAHVGGPAAGLVSEGDMLMIVGTSTCHMSVSKKGVPVPGICGFVEDGIIPGCFGYEAGQSSVGDLFNWFVSNCVSPEYHENAGKKGISIQQYLTELAEQMKPGENGILALDWLSGNRSTLADFDLSAMIIGMTMRTRPEDIYRALIEATAFGTKVIVENYRAHGIPVNRMLATGGVSRKNAFAMQLYADILEMPVYVVDTPVGPALGSAIFGALAAGNKLGGYDDIVEAIHAMCGKVGRVFNPDESSFGVYRSLYKEYSRLYDYFGRGENTLMKTLKKLSAEAKK